MWKSNRPPRPNSFTLVELLVVIALMAILVSISIPTFFSVLRSSNLTTGCNALADQLNLARQTAMSRNCQVEFRFYQLPDPNTPSATTPSIFRAFQSLSLDDSGRQTNSITKVTYLPNQIYLSTNTSGTYSASTLLATNTPSPILVTGSTAGTGLGTYSTTAYQYVAFHFKSDGSTDLNPATASLWYISLANQHDAIAGAPNILPTNYTTIKLDAETGRIRVFRPN